jgi:hypothetical protein
MNKVARHEKSCKLNHYFGLPGRLWMIAPIADLDAKPPTGKAMPWHTVELGVLLRNPFGLFHSELLI